MRARRADGKQFSRLTDEQGRLATNMASDHAAFNEIR
jgi:hypothetical protein